MRKKTVAVVGAGFSGAVIAYRLARAGYLVDVYEVRAHVGGNCHTERDPHTGVLHHVYGPHIFNTNDEAVWEFVNKFDEFTPTTLRTKAIAGGAVYSFPINLLTMNQFFHATFSPQQAREFIDHVRVKSIVEPHSFEEQALASVGRELYEAFFKWYTIKQWGLHPSLLPASTFKRIPIRFNYDDNRYDSQFQGIPVHGYTYIIDKLLDHAGIKVHLQTPFDSGWPGGYRHIFYSGPIDAWFGWREGRLKYRTLDFTREIHRGDYQGCAVMTYCDATVPWTRITEHKHFAPHETHEQTLVVKEFSRLCGPIDIPFYPIKSPLEVSLLAKYAAQARALPNVTFVGRLGNYQYIDMDRTIIEAYNAAYRFIHDRPH